MINAESPENLEKAAACLNQGGVVILPTDTVYGLAAHPGRPAAVARICTIKGRPTGKPIALLASDRQAVIAFGALFPDTAMKLAERYWPGALTLVLPCGDGYEGFRIPDHPVARCVIATCGGVLRVTSANLSGKMPACSAIEALKDVGLEADVVIDDGVSPGGVPSTVVQFESDGTFRLLREGAIPFQELQALIAG